MERTGTVIGTSISGKWCNKQPQRGKTQLQDMTYTHDATMALLQTMCRLTNEDRLIWEHTFNGTDCEYVALYRNKEIRLNCCDPNHRRLLMDNLEIPFSNQAAGVLCNEITKQRIRLDLKERTEQLEELNHWLKEENEETISIATAV